ncbi:MAG TPA: VWA domain-containing protein, partial [Chloroflexaceae bacterium]|nr:VWA domain-containing protein [Chloroflexaceae bacterium]
MTVSFIYPQVLWLLLLLPLLWLLAWGTRFVARARLGRRRALALLAARSAILAGLVLAIAGAQVVRAVDDTAVVFLVDGSDSVAPAQRERALEYINAALEAGGPADQAAVVVFGAEPAVERAAAPPAPLRRLTSTVVASRTDIAAAVQLGLALLPADAQKRVVLLSDGAENQGRAREAARLAALRGVPIEVVPLPAEGGPDVLVAAVEAPVAARAGQSIPIVVRLAGGLAGPARVELLADGQLVAAEEVELAPGQSELTVSVPAGEAGFRRFEARVSAPADSQPLNNTGAAFTQVEGPPRVLLLAGSPDRAAPLRAALEAGDVTVEALDPAQAPADPALLRQYAAIFLVDVPAAAVAPEAQRALATYVRDQGGGLAMVGGAEAFGAGGWRRTPVAEILPVDLDPPPQEDRPDLALALVIDRSGSMAESAGPGRNRLSLAKEAVYLAAQGLASRDQLGVFVFDEQAQTVMPMQPLPDLATIEEALGQVSLGGGTNIRAGVQLAMPVLAAADARVKHMILLTDGLDNSNYTDLIDQMRTQGTTVTVVSIGGDANPSLEGLAERGGGAFYRVRTAQDVPRIFLSETVRVAGRDLVEGAFAPVVALNAPPVRGLGALPPLYGYNGVGPRQAARTILATPDGDPLLAVWQVGLGRSLAWTSDLKGQWAAEWLGWAGFPPFAQGLVDALLPPPTAGRLSLEARAEGAEAVLDLIVAGDDGRPAEAGPIEGRLLDPAGRGASLSFTQVAPGRYRAAAPAEVPGVYLAQVAALDEAGQALGAVSGGLVVSYSPEYGPRAGGEALLAELAALTGGRADPLPAALFASPGQPVGRVTEIGLPLLWLALALLPLDIALRRLFLAREALAPLV